MKAETGKDSQGRYIPRVVDEKGTLIWQDPQLYLSQKLALRVAERKVKQLRKP